MWGGGGGCEEVGVDMVRWVWVGRCGCDVGGCGRWVWGGRCGYGEVGVGM